MTVNEEGHYGGDITCFFTEKVMECPDYLYQAPYRRRAEQQRAAALAQQHAAEEQQRRSRLEAQVHLDEKTRAFADKHGVNGGWVNWQRLRANPFSYDGNILLFRAHFERMISPTLGIFSGLRFVDSSSVMIVTDLPRDTFLEPKVILLAAKVTGHLRLRTS